MIRKSIAVLLLMVVIVQKMNTQTAVEGKAYAEVIAALTAFENKQLSFGKFSPGVGGGEIVITPEGVRTAQGSVILGGALHNRDNL